MIITVPETTFGIIAMMILTYCSNVPVSSITEQTIGRATWNKFITDTIRYRRSLCDAKPPVLLVSRPAAGSPLS
jgi:hypothetical protein